MIQGTVSTFFFSSRKCKSFAQLSLDGKNRRNTTEQKLAKKATSDQQKEAKPEEAERPTKQEKTKAKSQRKQLLLQSRDPTKRNWQTPLLMLLESKLKNLLARTDHVVEDPLITLLPKHSRNENDTLIYFLSVPSWLRMPSSQPMILKGLLPARHLAPRDNLNCKVSPNLRGYRTTNQKMINGLFVEPAKNASSLILQPATPQAICCPTPPPNSQPHEDFAFQRRPSFPDGLSTRKPCRTCEESPIRRLSRIMT